jgi:hypothetical protein
MTACKQMKQELKCSRYVFTVQQHLTWTLGSKQIDGNIDINHHDLLSAVTVQSFLNKHTCTEHRSPLLVRAKFGFLITCNLPPLFHSILLCGCLR